MFTIVARAPQLRALLGRWVVSPLCSFLGSTPTSLGFGVVELRSGPLALILEIRVTVFFPLKRATALFVVSLRRDRSWVDLSFFLWALAYTA